jgi:outer membrane protein TolC
MRFRSALVFLTIFSLAALNGQAPEVVKPSDGGRLDWLRNPYRAPHVAEPNLQNSGRIYDLVRAGNIYLSLADAIALVIENNLDVEVARYQIPEAQTDTLRAKGGGALRGISSYYVTELPQGVGGPLSPLVTGAATGSTPNTSVPNDVYSLTLLTGVLQNLALSNGSTYSAGPPIPTYDPTVVGSLNWQHSTTPENSMLATGTNTFISNNTSGSLSLQQGFSTGTQYSIGYNSSSESVNSPTSTYSPYTSGSLGLTVTQPLLRGFGPSVNRRFIQIGKNNEKVSMLLFQQQVITAIYGISRLYYDLAALNEDLHVKTDTLAAARSLFENTRAGVEEGTMAPVERTRAEAEVAGSEEDLINTQGLVDEEEVILKNLLTRGGSRDPILRGAHIICTEPMNVPEQEPAVIAEDLLAQALADRPDLSQGALQVSNSQIYLKGSRNELLPELDIVGSASNASLAGQMNSLATGTTTTNPTEAANTGGYGTSLGQLFSAKYPSYGVGIQLNFPIRNRIAQADVERDELQYRQAQASLQQLRNQAQLEVDAALAALRRARAAYDAAVKTRMLQAQSLEVEQVRYEAGVDTAFFVIQYQSYLAQARSTEVVSKANYFKARAALDRAVGASLEKNNISVDEAYHGKVSRPPTPPPVLGEQQH